MSPLIETVVAQVRHLEANLDEELVRFAALHVADTVAVSLAAVRSEAADAAIRAATFGGAGGSSHVIGVRASCAPPAAAFANAALAHALDFDEIHDGARLHPATVTLPAALACAEAVGGDGRSVITAMLVGSEIMCRFGLALNPDGTGRTGNWMLTQLLGYLGGGIAAGLVLGLDDAGLSSTLGAAAMQASGPKEGAAGVGASLRSIYPAFAAYGGTLAAVMAYHGATAPSSTLDGPRGLLAAYLDPLLFDASVLHMTRWAYRDAAIKPWPACRLAHPYISAALEIRSLADRPLIVDEIAQVTLEVNATGESLSQPLPARHEPSTLADAKYSLPYVTALALLHGRVDLDTAGPGCLTDRELRALARKVLPRRSLPDSTGHSPAEITLTFTSGQHLTAAADLAALTPGDDEVAAKLRSCIEYAAANGDMRRSMEVAIEAALQLEQVGSAGLADLMGPALRASPV